tara:strand:+ start:569 stop:1414 length:846 start_codon:yes stop_codon:yes gene_type:complete
LITNLNKLRLLVAFPYLTTEIVQFIAKKNKTIEFVLDSGAFTAWKGNIKINLDDYCKAIETLPFKPFRYFTLDVIGNPEKTYNNYIKMVDRGLNPVPIMTRGEDLDMIEEYYKTSDLIGIGGLVGTAGNKKFVKQVMSVIKDRKVHWLGFTNINLVSLYNPYMCDSSAWLSSRRYARVSMKHDGKIFNLSKKIVMEADFLNKDKHMYNYIKSLGISPMDLKHERAWTGGHSLIAHISARSHIDLSYYYKKIFNTRFFLALANFYDLELLYKNYIALQGRLN